MFLCNLHTVNKQLILVLDCWVFLQYLWKKSLLLDFFQEFRRAYNHALLLKSNPETQRLCLFNLASSYIEANEYLQAIDILKTLLEAHSSVKGKYCLFIFNFEKLLIFFLIKSRILNKKNFLIAFNIFLLQCIWIFITFFFIA